MAQSRVPWQRLAWPHPATARGDLEMARDLLAFWRAADARLGRNNNAFL